MEVSMIGKIITAGAIPSGFALKTKGVRESVYTEIITAVAGLEPKQALELPAADVEKSLGRALPKYFKANLRKKLVEKFGKGKVEMVELVSEANKTSLFQIQKLEA